MNKKTNNDLELLKEVNDLVCSGRSAEASELIEDWIEQLEVREYEPLGKAERTDRGFQIIRFQDQYRMHCNIQQSSLALFEQPGSSALWIGRSPYRMHLTLDQVRAIVDVLQNWVYSGQLQDREKYKSDG